MVYKMQKLVMTAAGRDGLPACYCGALTETPSTASRKEQTTEENPLAINGRKKMNIFRGCARKKRTFSVKITLEITEPHQLWQKPQQGLETTKYIPHNMRRNNRLCSCGQPP